ncbi:MAG: SDR family oxidoreductase [Clostridia bacterium]|nr:SDR family oxidoreductase [Clostridia bacterium]MBQ8924727.1 SDR family oxidoreductase [Clostridia bacterium]
MANRLDGKVAIVTGAASGMGKAIAMDFLKEGAKVLAVDINTDRLEELVEDVEDEELPVENLVTTKGNICSDEDCKAAVDLAVEKFGTLNVLSHNAGVIDDMTLIDEMTNEAWDKCIAVNLTGTMKICRAALQYFVPNEIPASMVLITSNGAFESATGGPAYCASKAGANAFMKSIAFEFGRKGIRCNSICPGPVLTNITDSAPVFNERGSEVHNKSGYNAHAWEWTGGIIAMPEDISPLAVYLASDESSFVNGASHVIDSGVCLSR